MRGIRLGARGARARATCAGTSALTLPRRLRGLYAMLVFRRFTACLQLEREELDGPDGAGGKEPRALLRGQQCSACQKRRRVPLTCALFDLPRRTAQFDQWRYIIYFAITLVGGSFPSIKKIQKRNWLWAAEGIWWTRQAGYDNERSGWPYPACHNGADKSRSAPPPLLSPLPRCS